MEGVFQKPGFFYGVAFQTATFEAALANECGTGSGALFGAKLPELRHFELLHPRLFDNMHSHLHSKIILLFCKLILKHFII